MFLQHGLLEAASTEFHQAGIKIRPALDTHDIADLGGVDIGPFQPAAQRARTLKPGLVLIQNARVGLGG
jgi:hypothetical protein